MQQGADVAADQAMPAAGTLERRLF